MRDRCKPMGCRLGKVKLLDLVGDATGRDLIITCDALLVVYAHLCSFP